MQDKPQPTVHLPVFEGPFDLLFHLVQKAEVEIWAVSIAEITGQYLTHLKKMKELNLEVASEFLVMAATLLRLKSRLLLPRPPRNAAEEMEEESLYDINSPEELFQRLQEYRTFKKAAGFFKEREEEQQKIFLRSSGGPKTIPVDQPRYCRTGLDSAAVLYAAMMHLLECAAARSADLDYTPAKDHALPERMELILELLLEQRGALPLRALCRKRGLWESVLTLLALLELTRQRRVYLYQEKPFGVILAARRGKRKEAKLDGAADGKTDH